MTFTTIDTDKTNASGQLLDFEKTIGDRGTIIRYAIIQTDQPGLIQEEVENRSLAVSAIEAWESGDVGVAVKIRPNGTRFVPEQDLQWMSLDQATAKFGTQVRTDGRL